MVVSIILLALEKRHRLPFLTQCFGVSFQFLA